MFDWLPKFISVDRVRMDDESSKADVSPVLSVEGFPPSGEAFIDLIDHQLSKLLKSKVDTGVSSPCKAYSFRDNENGERDRSWIEDSLLGAETLGEFSLAAQATGQALVGLPGARDGILVQVLLRVSIEESTMDLVFISFLEFQSSERMIFSDEVDLEAVSDVIKRDPTKAILYPFGTPDEIRTDMVKVLCRPASDPWPEIMALFPPASTERLLQDEVAKAVMEVEPEKWPDRKGLFRDIPPKKRQLLGEERLVPQDMTLEPSSAAAVARRCSRTSEDLYDKDQVLDLDVGGAKVTLQMRFMGERFQFYRHQGEEILVLRAPAILTKKGALSPADFIDPKFLDDDELPE